MSRRLAALFPFAVFLLLAAVSWNRWVEPFVDTGRELMVPWRLAQGESLYRDVRFYYGPLGPYLAAGVDLAFGTSFAARIALAGAIALLHLAALGALARRLLPPRATGLAALAAALAVAVSFFLRPGGCHLFPYSLDTALAVAAVTGALLAAHSGGSPRGDRAAAVCLAAALLARPEIGLAGIAALAVERLASGDSAARKRLVALAAVPLGVAAVAYAALSIATPLPVLKKEGWLTFLFLPAEFRSVYASFSGVDRPVLRLAELALAVLALAGVALWLLLSSVLAERAGRRSPAAARLVEAAAIGTLAVLAVLRLRPPEALRGTAELLPPLVRALPPLLAATAVFGLVRRLARRSGARGTARSPVTQPGPLLPGVPDSVLLVSLFFALRLFLAAGYVGPYNGFYLPLPLVVGVALLTRAGDRLPERFSRVAPPVAFPRLLAAALTVFLGARVAALALMYRHPAWSRVPTPAGALFVPEPVADATRRALADLDARVPPQGSFVGFPEIGFFHWTLRRKNPLAQDQFFPGHLDAAAEAEAIERVRRNPADAAVYVNVLTIGHGPTAFGRDYLERLDRFVRQSYPVSRSFGPGARREPRIGDPGFFVEVRTR